jgi:hypothetical protein
MIMTREWSMQSMVPLPFTLLHAFLVPGFQETILARSGVSHGSSIDPIN